MIKLFFSFLYLLFPFGAVFLVLAFIFKWCGKSATVADGFRIVLDGVIGFFKDDTSSAVVCYEIEEHVFDSFTREIQKFFDYVVFDVAHNCGAYIVVRYRVGGIKVPLDVIEVEWIKFIKRIYNISSQVKIPIFVNYDEIEGIVDLYCAFNNEGNMKLQNIKANIKSRKIPPNKADIEE